MVPTRRFLMRMIIFLAAVLLAAGATFPVLREAFLANAVLNGLIIGVLLLGIGYSFRQVLTLRSEAAFLEEFQRNPQIAQRPGIVLPSLLGPTARMVADRRGRASISAMSMRSLLDGLSARLDEARDISRYLIGLLIFLGLLGTFWGLIGTVGAIGNVIGGLQMQGRGLDSVFGDLQAGLEAPLVGMGTAFSSSLFGLAGSLVLGFLDLQAGQAQNRFFNAIEEWLAGLTRLTGTAIGTEGEPTVPAYIQALLEQTADNLDNLQRTIQFGENSRLATNTQLVALTDKLSMLTDQMRAEQTLMMRLAEGQMEIRPVLNRLSEALQSGFGADETTRGYIRSIDSSLTRISREMETGRTQAVAELRGEIKVLTRTIAALAEGGER